jgi:hypothetical protein
MTRVLKNLRHSPSVIIIIIIINRNLVDTRWQQYSTHLHAQYTEYTDRNIRNTKKKLVVHAVPCLCELYFGICHTTEEKAQ